MCPADTFRGISPPRFAADKTAIYWYEVSGCNGDCGNGFSLGPTRANTELVEALNDG